MSTKGRKSSKEAEKPQANPKKRKYRAPDASKRPETITTKESVNSLIDSLYNPPSIGNDRRRKVRQGVEEFTRILMKTLLQTALADRNKPEEDSNGRILRGHSRRVGPQEIWKAFVEHETLKPFAFRFLELGLVPAEFLPLFEYKVPTEDSIAETESAPLSEESEESDSESSDDFHPFLAAD